MTSHTHKAMVYRLFNGQAEPMLTVYHRSHREAVECVDCKKYIDRHQTAHGIYADCLQKTIEGA